MAILKERLHYTWTKYSEVVLLLSGGCLANSDATVNFLLESMLTKGKWSKIYRI